MDGLSPSEYESLTGITKAEYEQRVLAGARDAALEVYPPGSRKAVIETIALEGEALDTRLVVLFRIPARPDCVFGCRTRLWPTDEPTEDDAPETDGAWCIYLGVDEYVDQGGLVVHKCEPEGITWLR